MKSIIAANLRALVQIGGAVRSMACSADGERLAVTFASQGTVGEYGSID